MMCGSQVTSVGSMPPQDKVYRERVILFTYKFRRQKRESCFDFSLWCSSMGRLYHSTDDDQCKASIEARDGYAKC